MIPEPPPPHNNTLLTAQRLRERVREARGGFAPDHVARWLHHRDPALLESDADELAEILAGLAESARARLADAGVRMPADEGAPLPRLSRREREYVGNLAALLAALCTALSAGGRQAEALEAGREGVAWCLVARDERQQSILWITLASAHLALGSLEEEERAADNAVAAARASREPIAIVAALENLASLLIVRWRLEDAESRCDEALALVRGGLGDEERSRYYARLLMHKGRIGMNRTNYSQSITLLREALRWADETTDPDDRAAILAHLGSVYLRLEHYRQSVECQQQVVRIGHEVGSDTICGWGYFRLAEAHFHLNELEETGEALDRADECIAGRLPGLATMIGAKRAQLYATTGEFEAGLERCRELLGTTTDKPDGELHMFLHTIIAEIEVKRGNPLEAETHYRLAVGIAEREFPQRTPTLKVNLAEVLYTLGRRDEVTGLVSQTAESPALNDTEHVKVLRLQALLAEEAGELRTVIALEREASLLERTLLERRAEQSLRNARIVAETDLLEREAETERERRHRVERELADTRVELSDRNRLVETVEQRLQRAVADATGPRERSVIKTLQDTVASIREAHQPLDVSLHYLSSIDNDFFSRLRSRFPALTPKQERLCGLLRAGLASREIGTLLALEPEGLKAQRKRLRKRLGMGPDESLEKFLAGI
ncbi:MAG TPA: hypothetical protein VHI13_06115 [Candidatus Kapabacteria bacterium]|nr:hypothetical protein [Candidatus Kapabacteria bacterium]